MILEFKGNFSKADSTFFIIEGAMVIRDVEIEPGSNIWFHSIVQADPNHIRTGSNVKIQDA